MTVVNVNKLYFKKKLTRLLFNITIVIKSNMLKSTKKAKMKLCISPKKNGEKQGELLIKLNATKERNKTRYVDSL